MKDAWQLSLKNRLQYWRSFRKEVETFDAASQLQAVLDFWKTTPLSSRVIDPYDISTWPDPWEMLRANVYDDNVVALGMAYTLHYSGTDCSILLVQNINTSEIKLIVLVDELHILNYNYNKIDTLKVIDEFEILTNTKVNELNN